MSVQPPVRAEILPGIEREGHLVDAEPTADYGQGLRTEAIVEVDGATYRVDAADVEPVDRVASD